MTYTTLSRPEILRSTDLREILRWNKHTTDNIDALAAQLRAPAYLALTRATIGPTYANAGSGLVAVSFGVLESPQQGSALDWSLIKPDTVFVRENGFYLVNSQFSWSVAAGGNERLSAPYIETRNLFLGSANGVKGGFNTSDTCWMGPLYAGDELRLRVYQDSGGTLGEAAPPRLALLKLSL